VTASVYKILPTPSLVRKCVWPEALNIKILYKELQHTSQHNKDDAQFHLPGKSGLRMSLLSARTALANIRSQQARSK